MPLPRMDVPSSSASAFWERKRWSMDRAFSASRAMVVGSVQTNSGVGRRVVRGIKEENGGGRA